MIYFEIPKELFLRRAGFDRNRRKTAADVGSFAFPFAVSLTLCQPVTFINYGIYYVFKKVATTCGEDDKAFNYGKYDLRGYRQKRICAY